MSFKKKTWKQRLSEFPTRRRLIHTDGSTETVDVERLEGTVSQEGDAFSEENMNDLEERIEAALKELLLLTGGTLTGTLSSSDIYPKATNAHYLGNSELAWIALYATNWMLTKNGANYGHAQCKEGTTDAVGEGIFALGNDKPKGTSGNAIGRLRLYNESLGFTDVIPEADQSVVLTLPSGNGTLLRREDITVSGDEIILEWL